MEIDIRSSTYVIGFAILQTWTLGLYQYQSHYNVPFNPVNLATKINR